MSLVIPKDPCPAVLDFISKVKAMQEKATFSGVRISVRRCAQWYAVTFTSRYLSATCLAQIWVRFNGKRTLDIETKTRAEHGDRFCPISIQSDSVSAMAPVLRLLADLDLQIRLEER